LVVWGCIVKAQQSGENDYRSLEAAKRPASDRFFTAELKKPSAAATDNQDLPKDFFSKLRSTELCRRPASGKIDPEA
jgi:hypothetical protein